MNATVVVSCYNQEDYIKECLDSILSQEVDFDFDILIADDCSTDLTRAHIKHYQQLYSDKLRVIERSQNLGAAKNYLDAHKRASGEIVFHIDGDDVMLPGKLQKQYTIFRENPSVNLVFHRAQYFSDDGSYCSDTGSPCFMDKGVLYFNASDLARWGTITVHSSYAYRKSSRRFLRGDIEFMEWFFAMDSLVPEGQGAYIDEVLVKYRCNPVGASYLSSKSGRKRAYRVYFNDLFYYFSQYPYLRKNLYSNAIVTAGGMLQNQCFWGKSLLFLIKNFFYFNWSSLRNAMRMRRAVAPGRKIR